MWANMFAKLAGLGHIGIGVTLFLIGTGISSRTIKQARPHVLFQGTILWILVATGSLLCIWMGWIHL